MGDTRGTYSHLLPTYLGSVVSVFYVFFSRAPPAEEAELRGDENHPGRAAVPAELFAHPGVQEPRVASRQTVSEYLGGRSSKPRGGRERDDAVRDRKLAGPEGGVSAGREVCDEQTDRLADRSGEDGGGRRDGEDTGEHGAREADVRGGLLHGL